MQIAPQFLPTFEVSGTMGGSEGGTIEHTNSQTDVLLGPFVTVDGGREVLKSSKIS